MPTARTPYLRMAEIQVGAKNKDGARNSLIKGLALQPDSLPMQRAMILLDVDDKKLDAALAKARDIQKKQPKMSAGHVLEGDIHVIGKAWSKAAAAYRAGLKVTPTTDLAERLYTVLLLDGKTGDAASFADIVDQGTFQGQCCSACFLPTLRTNARTRRQRWRNTATCLRCSRMTRHCSTISPGRSAR